MAPYGGQQRLPGGRPPGPAVIRLGERGHGRERLVLEPVDIDEAVEQQRRDLRVHTDVGTLGEEGMRTGGADGGRKRGRDAAVRRQAVAPPGEHQPGPRRRDPDVAGQRQAGTAADGRPVDGPDDRPRARDDRLDDIGEGCRVGQHHLREIAVLRGVAPLPRAAQRAKVAAGAERRAFGPQQHRPGAAGGEGLAQLVDGLPVEGVAAGR